MYLTTGRMVQVAKKMNQVAAEIDDVLQPNVKATRRLSGPTPLSQHLDQLTGMLRPLAQ